MILIPRNMDGKTPIEMSHLDTYLDKPIYRSYISVLSRRYFWCIESKVESGRLSMQGKDANKFHSTKCYRSAIQDYQAGVCWTHWHMCDIPSCWWRQFHLICCFRCRGRPAGTLSGTPLTFPLCCHIVCVLEYTRTTRPYHHTIFFSVRRQHWYVFDRLLEPHWIERVRVRCSFLSK